MFIECFEKVAKKEDHHVERFLIGNPISSAIHAKKGKKKKAFDEAYMHNAIESLKGAVPGAAIGGAVAAHRLHKRRKIIENSVSSGRFRKASERRYKMGRGGLIRSRLALGALIGGAIGGIKGNHDAESTRIHKKYQK